jgi:hypothetical protein
MKDGIVSAQVFTSHRGLVISIAFEASRKIKLLL